MFHVETLGYPRSMRRIALLLVFVASSAPSFAQWTIEDSHTTASLRGIHNVGGGVAWASGTNGTVLRTEDGGYLWQTCSMPPGAENLDFRGIQAFDEKTAIVMSSGKGDLSRLYKTTDACQTWKLVFTNPDPQGFYDGLKMLDATLGIVFGDPAKALSPVEGGPLTFRMRVTVDSGTTWTPVTYPRAGATAGTGFSPLANESFFAASNSSLVITAGQIILGTSGGRIISRPLSGGFRPAGCAGMWDPYSMSCGIPFLDWTATQTPMGHGTQSSGIFSLAGNGTSLVAVGGDYSRPATASNNAAFSHDSGRHWQLAQTPPHGYRSAVAYNADHKAWITVGPNGTDISIDDGKNWRALKPGKDDAAGADRDWNALSLPFVVGPKGRIGKLDANAVTGLNGR